MYEIAKDFQPIIAAFFVLLAAGLAYYSAQRFVRIQSETAARQTAALAAKEAEAAARQRAAFLIRTIELLISLIETLDVYLRTLSGIAIHRPGSIAVSAIPAAPHRARHLNLRLWRPQRPPMCVWSNRRERQQARPTLRIALV